VGCIPNWFDGYNGIDEKVVSYKSMRCVIEFEFSFKGFGNSELSGPRESAEEEYAR